MFRERNCGLEETRAHPRGCRPRLPQRTRRRELPDERRRNDGRCFDPPLLSADGPPHDASRPSLLSASPRRGARIRPYRTSTGVYARAQARARRHVDQKIQSTRTADDAGRRPAGPIRIEARRCRPRYRARDRGGPAGTAAERSGRDCREIAPPMPLTARRCRAGFAVVREKPRRRPRGEDPDP